MEKDLNTGIDTGPPQVEESGGPEVEAAAKNVETLLTEQLLQQQEAVQKNHDSYLRALAEVENIKKRGLREREEYLKYANVGLIKKLLPILDDLQRAIEVARTAKDFEVLSKGVEMTARSLDDLLKAEGVQVIKSVGEPFDPQYHQALTVEVSDEYPENTVIDQLQPGYILHDRVIRPSLVKVSSK